MAIMSKGTEVTLPCLVGKIDATFFIKGDLEDNSWGDRKEICPGCQRLHIEEIQEAVKLSRSKKMKIHVMDQSRFIGGERKLVVGTCADPAMTERGVAEEIF